MGSPTGTRGDELTVLVVEDNRGDVHLIREGFEESGVERSLTVVNDGKAALDYLSRRSDPEAESRPDLVLLDLNLPKVNGREVLEAIKDDENLSSIPTLVLSGSGSEEHIIETRDLGADGYYIKPVDPHEFISLVGSIARSVTASEPLPPGEYSKLDCVE